MKIKYTDLRVVSLLLLLTLSCGCSSLENSDLGWVSLFDGKSLDGWTVKCRAKDTDKKYWSVEDGAILADVPKGSKHHYIWLLSEREYADFELCMKVTDYDGKGVLDDEAHRSHNVGLQGHIALQIHPGGPTRLRFRDVVVRELQ